MRKYTFRGCEIIKAGNTIRCNVAYKFEGRKKITLKVTRITGLNKPTVLGFGQGVVHGITPAGERVHLWLENIYNEELL
jgi:hypothetical protein